jgi:hypothetical protein
MKTIDEYKKEGKAFRKVTSRKSLGSWEVKTVRSLVKDLIWGQEETKK